ncbi:MAG: succinate dehydrogenase, cytochrome b556 subunit [Pseudomonadales bacterium]|nr:succinate dehydrogenase, cytochrome b556 subunit [Pseudomonadales bacterium]MCJ8336979.1 succinate dehydrogenase, cytochrome b556 subunit [Pseudomonadales bacterium]NRA14409.1 succinate dehydrogenase, cytochrome b556 subunit [Oceanospirillaceae bacterium]
MNKKRPVNLDFSTIHMPLPAITSILHRISGIALFFGAVFMMYALGLSLESEAGFQETITMFEESIFAKLIAWGLLSALAYHSVVGVKHLFMDAGHFEELESGMLAAKAALVISGVLIVLAGVWVW